MPLSLLSPEAQLLLRVAGGPENDAAICALLDGPLDWPKLLAYAEREKAETVLWRRLRALACSRVPPEAAARLQKLAMIAEFRMAHLEQRLADAVRVLADAGIAATLLKGAALIRTVYSSAALRPMRDIDVLIEPERAYEAWGLLRAAGWTWSGGDEPDERYRGHHHLPPLEDASGVPVSLEVHTGLFVLRNPFRLSAAELARSARPVPVGARVAYAPAAPYLLLHVALHFAWSHALVWGAWRTLRDVAAIADAGVDWNAFVALAKESRGASCCYWTLRLARNLTGAAVPEEVLRTLRPPLPEAVLRRLEQHFTFAVVHGERDCPSIRLELQMWQLAVLPRLNGHGSIRPWDRSGEFAPGDEGTGAPPARPTSYVESVRRLTDYLRSILLVSPVAGGVRR